LSSFAEEYQIAVDIQKAIIFGDLEKNIPFPQVATPIRSEKQN
jgi:hypothetical protein